MRIRTRLMVGAAVLMALPSLAVAAPKPGTATTDGASPATGASTTAPAATAPSASMPGTPATAAAAAPPSTTAAPAASASAATPAASASGEVVAGATVKDTNGGTVGTIESVDGQYAVLSTGKHKVRLPMTSFGKGAEGPVLAMTQAQVDAAAAAAAAKTAAP